LYLFVSVTIPEKLPIMTKHLSKFTITLLFLFNIISIKAQLINQSVMISGGDNYKQQNIEFSWTMGEVVTETHENTNIIFNQGFQQQTEKSTFVGINPIHAMSYMVYPNPASEYIIIKRISTDSNLKFCIYSLQGILLRNGVITENETRVSLEGINAGILLIKLIDSDIIQPQTFKILKITL